MRLSTKGRYAVMALVDLAKHGTGNPISLAEIAERQEISLSYLEQLFAKLRTADLVRSVRGPGGGYLLSRGAGGTRISDIILAVDEPIRATRCSPGAPVGCRGNQTRCLTHDLWEELGHQIHLYRRRGGRPHPRYQPHHDRRAAPCTSGRRGAVVTHRERYPCWLISIGTPPRRCAPRRRTPWRRRCGAPAIHPPCIAGAARRGRRSSAPARRSPISLAQLRRK